MMYRHHNLLLHLCAVLPDLYSESRECSRNIKGVRRVAQSISNILQPIFRTKIEKNIFNHIWTIFNNCYDILNYFISVSL